MVRLAAVALEALTDTELQVATHMESWYIAVYITSMMENPSLNKVPRSSPDMLFARAHAGCVCWGTETKGYCCPTR